MTAGDSTKVIYLLFSSPFSY